ncbi:biopolymer transporter Tol [Algoriphagus zhangzhouensis]|uniref:Component of the Tol biopolymer transport system n=1 Tax=Algoriphagus zhangzhouensis TaxID=1073327 RepID=A0A1M7ZDE0_9BACT|nr:biopolymer transporter Tol [Algoriphagus zhangzhouensis]TDY45788.1 Tol biopolymer transport system component [Algoriphagus zhangzhouensis]SHO62900.1 component of the Tol biopolymer transport system [Algoriphagus zhangzhouensis]
MQIKLTRFVLFLGFWLVAGGAFAQFDQERFGKNRVQHKEFEWYFYSSNNFEVYYYDRGGANAKMAIEYLESEFNRLTQMIGYVAYTKPKIYIYNSPEELLQSNLNLNKETFSEEGQTNFSRLIAEVAFKGEMDLFKEDLIYGTSKVIIQEMLYGASVADAFQSNLMNGFPDWYVDGIALYLAKGWSMQMDDYIRHYLKEDENPKILKLKSLEAALVGQSVWNYIAERYGRRYISSILNLSRINRNEENSIANTVGLNYKTFTDDWKKYYLTINQQVTQNFRDIDRGSAIAETSKRVIGVINDIKFSPDGLNLAYVINNGGKYKVQIREISSGNERTLMQGGAVYEDQNPNFRAPVIAWRDSANLAIASFKRGITTLRLRSIDGSNQDKIFLRNITEILSLDFNSTGKNMVLSAISNGKTDIYTLNTRGQGRRLTNDEFDDLTPMFLNDSTIIYSTNYTDEVDSTKNQESLEKFQDSYNLFLIENRDTLRISRLTNASSKNMRPRKVNSNSVIYLSDLSGINNLMRMTVGSQVTSQISGYNLSLESFDVNSRMNKIAFSVRDGKESFLILQNYSGADQFTPSTPRVQLEQAKSLNERIAARRVMEEAQKEPAERGGESLPTQANKEENQVQIDTTANNKTTSINLDRLKFQNRNGINTENYTFDTLPKNVPNRQQASTAGQENKINLLESFRKQGLQKRVVGPRRMEPQFFTNNINTRFIVDPLRGFGISLQGKMTDLLDNHSFQGGVTTALDFRSGGDLYFEYEYLPGRLDFRGRFDRKTIRISEGDITFQKYVLTKVEAGVSYPFNVNARFTVAPFLAKSQYFNLNPDSLILGQVPEENRYDVNYGGAKAELVFDKTRQIGLYSQTGFKGKVGFVHYQGLNHADRSFSNFYLDFRNYQVIHKNIVLASKLYAGSFFGKNPQTYLVGGMDNWLFNEFYNPPSNRPESSPVRNPTGVENSNILFADFMDLRGYDYDEIRGNNVITFTTELRIPVFSYLTRGNITSNFIRNFQLVGFYDIGSAWDESAPWERVNDQNTEVINTEGSPFTIVLNNFNNPWLQSYGAGLRTVLLNYYVKFDVARPIRNYEAEDLKFYVTLGYNF